MLLMFFLIAGGIIVGAIGLGAVYDYRTRRRGNRVSVTTDAALDHLLDVDLQGGKDSMTDRYRDQ
jgi:hypothetical protein